MARRTYVGPIDEIYLDLGDGEIFVERGDVVDVTNEMASRLDQQPDNWATPRHTTTKEGD